MTEMYGERVFRTSSGDEGQRLDAMSETFDRATTNALSSLGSMSGWRCLDAGAGKGALAQWLGEQVGAAGRVVAVDIDTAALEAVPRRSFEILHGDITDPALPLGTYDLVHARLLLANLR